MTREVSERELTEIFSRTELLIGREALERLQGSRVAVFGVGGVGGHVVEALARSGVGSFELIDNDVVSPSNINRQIIATWQTVGQYKVDVMRERILSINPRAAVNVRRCFYLPETAEKFDFGEYSYVVDAVDTITAKIDIIMRAREAGTPVISSMGAGNKLDPSRFRVADIYQTSVCPLARVMRRELRKRGVESLKVVYSTEEAIKPEWSAEEAGKKGLASVPGSVAFVPAVAGLLMAGEGIRDLALNGDDNLKKY